MLLRSIVPLALCLCFLMSRADGLTLHFQYSIDDGTGQVASDDFYAKGLTDESVSDLFDSYDLRKPPALPGSSAHIQTWAGNIALLADSRYLEATAPNLFWPIELSVTEYEPSEIIWHTLKLIDPYVLASLPEGTLVYLHRYDASGIFLDYYDLTDPSNHTIVWQTASYENPSAVIRPVVIHGCIAANLDGTGTVNLNDFAILASYWLQSDVLGIADIDGSGAAGMGDLWIMAQHWLSDCLP